MAAFMYRDGRRELRRVPIPAPDAIRIVASFAPSRPIVHDMRTYPPRGAIAAPALHFRLRRASRAGARLIYDEVA